MTLVRKWRPPPPGRRNVFVHAFIQWCNYALWVLAVVGEAIIETRNMVLYAFLFVAGFMYAPFGMFVSSCFVSYAYVAHWMMKNG